MELRTLDLRLLELQPGHSSEPQFQYGGLEYSTATNQNLWNNTQRTYFGAAIAYIIISQ